MYLVYNYYLHTDVIFLSFLSIYVRVSVLGPYLMEPNVFKVADGFGHLLVHVRAVRHLTFICRGRRSGVAIFRFYLFNFLLWLPVFNVTFVQLLRY
jgi:hypothetical protein